jgi:hypothetical protein
MKLEELINKAFLALISVVAVWIGKEVDKMSDSVAELNVKMAVIVANQSMYERRLEMLEERKK